MVPVPDRPTTIRETAPNGDFHRFIGHAIQATTHRGRFRGDNSHLDSAIKRNCHFRVWIPPGTTWHGVPSNLRQHSTT